MNSRLLSVLLSIAVIGILIFAGPASAFGLGVILAQDSITFGQDLEADLSFELQEGDQYVPLQEFQLIITSQVGEDRFCTFDLEGGSQQGCEGLTITPLNADQLEFGMGYGYGYYGEDSYAFGYGYGITSDSIGYHVVIHTGEFQPGTYEIALTASVAGQDFSSEEETFSIVLSPFDLNKDGMVQTEDLEMLLENWGSVNLRDEISVASDFNHDMYVDGADLGLLLGAWTEN